MTPIISHTLALLVGIIIGVMTVCICIVAADADEKAGR